MCARPHSRAKEAASILRMGRKVQWLANIKLTFMKLIEKHCPYAPNKVYYFIFWFMDDITMNENVFILAHFTFSLSLCCQFALVQCRLHTASPRTRFAVRLPFSIANKWMKMFPLFAFGAAVQTLIHLQTASTEARSPCELMWGEKARKWAQFITCKQQERRKAMHHTHTPTEMKIVKV